MLVAIIEPFADQDVRPLARALIDRFGSLGAVLSAGWDARHPLLDRYPEIENRLGLMGDAIVHGLRTQAEGRPLLTEPKPIIDYLRWLAGFEQAEHFYVLFLDVRGHLIRADLMSLGTLDQSVVYPREIIRRALDLGAATLILAHNHPSGDPTPSEHDVAITSRLVLIGEGVGIAVYDHIIVTRGGWLSLRAEGLMQ